MTNKIVEELMALADAYARAAEETGYIKPSREALRTALEAALKQEQSEPYIYYDPDTGETWTIGAIEDGCRSVDGLVALRIGHKTLVASEQAEQALKDTEGL